MPRGMSCWWVPGFVISKTAQTGFHYNNPGTSDEAAQALNPTMTSDSKTSWGYSINLERNLPPQYLTPDQGLRGLEVGVRRAIYPPG